MEKVSIADPVRRQIIGCLDNRHLTIAEVADTLDVSDGRILFHIERLAKAELIALNKKGNNPREWVCSRIGEDPVGVSDEYQELIRDRTINDFKQASQEYLDGLFGTAGAVLFGLESRTRLSEEQAHEFRRRLQALVGEYFLPGRGDQTGIKYGFLGIVEPIDVHPLEDSIQVAAELHEDELDQLFEAIFEEEVDVSPAYATTAESLQMFDGTSELAEFAGTQLSVGSRRMHIVVRYVAGGPSATWIPISPDSYGSPGDCMKFSAEGWGLIHVQLKSLDKSGGVHVRIVANTQARAFGLAQDTFLSSGDPKSWDWKVVETHAHRLVHVLEKLGRPIQPRSRVAL